MGWPLPRSWPARSIAAIAEWATDTPKLVRAALGASRDPSLAVGGPSEPTIRRTLACLDAEALAAVIGAWLADRDRHNGRHEQQGRWRQQRAVALDGKTLRATRQSPRRRSTAGLSAR